MSADSYEIRLCPNCGLRYPLTGGHPFDKAQGRPFGERCPSCLGETQVVLKRTYSPLPFGREGSRVRGNLSALLDNLRSAWNVGAIFRTADGLGLDRLYLCGITPTPENEALRKTSLGAEETVAWEYSPNALETAKRLKGEGCRLVALEQDERAIPVEQIGNLFRGQIANLSHTVLILGNEVTGVDPELLDLCDQIVYIPMRGRKRSFNVEVTFAIAVYALFNTDPTISSPPAR